MAGNSSYWVESEDWHTAGELFRIIPQVLSGFIPEVQTVMERRFKIIRLRTIR